MQQHNAQGDDALLKARQPARQQAHFLLGEHLLMMRPGLGSGNCWAMLPFTSRPLACLDAGAQADVPASCAQAHDPR